MAGEWEARQKVDGEIAPGVRFHSASSWTAAAAFALPIWKDIRASHPDNRYRLMLSVGRAF